MKFWQHKILHALILTVFALPPQHDYREANNGPVCEQYKAGISLWDIDPRPGATYYNSVDYVDAGG